MTKETEKEKKNLTVLLICIILLFLANALYILYFVYRDFWSYPGEVLHKVFMMMWVLLVILYFASIFGIMQRRRFALYSSSLLLMLSVIVSAPLSGVIVFAVVGLLLYLVLLYFLWKNEEYFKRFDRLDKWILIGMVLLVISSVAAFEYSRCCVPDPEEYAELVTQEAIEKGDWRVCEKIQSGHRDDCIREVAVSLNNEGICKEISWDHLRSYCYDDVRKK